METDVQASSGWMVRWRVLNHSGPWKPWDETEISWMG